MGKMIEFRHLLSLSQDRPGASSPLATDFPGLPEGGRERQSDPAKTRASCQTRKNGDNRGMSEQRYTAERPRWSEAEAIYVAD
jgi:hypothetical protein